MTPTAFAYDPSISVKQTTQSVTTQIPFSTQHVQDAGLYEGTQKVIKPGIMGEKTTITKEHLLNTKSVRLDLFEIISKQPEDEIIADGTLPYPTIKDNTGKLIFPCNGEVTSTDKSGSHEGFKAIDVANSEGTPLLAPADGVITFVDGYGGYGNCLQMDSGQYHFLMGHLSSFNVVVGQMVTKGQQIGLMGNTGDSSGAHLHLEIYISGVKQYIPNIFKLEMGQII